MTAGHSYALSVAAAPSEVSFWAPSTFATGYEHVAQGHMSNLQAGTVFVASMAGVGIFGLPQAIAKGGGALYSYPIMGLCAWSVIEVANALDEALKIVEVRQRRGETFSFKQAMRLDDLGEVAFGHRGRMFAAALSNSFLLAMACVLIFLLGDGMFFLTGIPWTYSVCVTAVIFVPISMVDDVPDFADVPNGAIGTVAILVHALAVGIASLQAKTPLDDCPKVKRPHGCELGSAISVILFGLSCHMGAPRVRSAMRDPSSMPIACAGAVLAIALVNGVAAGLAFSAWGIQAQGNIMYSLSCTGCGGASGTDTRMVAGIVLAGMVCVYIYFITLPIVMSVVYKAAEDACGGYSRRVRSLIAILVFAVGLSFPSDCYLQFVALIGALLGVPVNIFLPLAIYWTLSMREGLLPGVFKAARHLLVVVIGLQALVFGTLEASASVLEGTCAFNSSAPEYQCEPG